MDDERVIVMAKVAIAAAWADGAIQPEEVAALRRNLARYDLSGAAWEDLRLYLEGEVDEAERRLLLRNLERLTTTDAEKQEAVKLIGRIVQADDRCIGDEERIAHAMQALLATTDTGLFKRLKALFPG